MITVFDFVTVGCFVCLVAAFFKWTDRSARILSRLLLSCIAFAIANHLGNVGFDLFGAVLLVGGAGYAALVIEGRA